MTITTAVPSPLFGPLGFIAPPASAVLTGVLTDTDAAFGGGLNLNLNTPQGQLSQSLTAIIDDSNAQFVLYTNLVDPALSSGRMQDAIGYIYFLTRNPAEPTTVASSLTGKNGTVIPAGSLAQAADGNTYSSTGTVTISAGVASVGFTCTVDGPIACPAGTLSSIYQAVPGWDTVTNAADGVPGVDVESAASFEARRAASVALNSMGPPAAVQAAVLATPGVIDAYTVDNSSGSPVTIQGQTIAANSLYCCASGGTNADVARAIWSRKGAGCSYTGGTTVTVTDTNSGYAVPQPTYSVSFQRPTNLSVFFAVSIRSSALVPSSALAQVQAANVATFAGLPSNPDTANTISTRARIGGIIFASDYFANISALGSWARVISVFVGSTNVTAASTTGSISGTALTVSSGTGIAVGQAVSGVNVAAGTIVVSGSGTSWVVNLSQTATSATVVFVAMTLADLTVNINQLPVLNAANTFLTLV